MGTTEKEFLSPISPESFRGILQVERSAQTTEEELIDMIKSGNHFLPWTLTTNGVIFVGKHDHQGKLRHNRIPPEDEWLRGDYRLTGFDINQRVLVESWHQDSFEKFCSTLGIHPDLQAAGPYINMIQDKLEQYCRQQAGTQN